ncbi:ABC transporter permease [Mesorhizobium sp. M0663]|uniref:ABC transporter permease n=1 Tax=unclassified Mesorhizobium TaxID=325217 RepID=UPI00333A6E3C
MSDRPDMAAPVVLDRARPDIRQFAAQAKLPGLVFLALLVLGLLDPRIVSSGNLWNIAIQTSYLALFAMAQTMVLLTRGFDLSLGFTVSLVSVISAMVMTGSGDMPILWGIVAGLGVGLLIGGLNGFLIAGVGINPLVTTLGMANIVMALASTVSGGFPVPGIPEAFTDALAEGRLIGIPVPILFAALCFALLFLVLRFTVFGRGLYLIGANPRAAKAAGVRTGRVVAIDYVVCSLLAAIGAMLLTARTGSGEPNLGGNLTLESIAAAVVGGVRLTGGEGGVTAALLGALFITVISNAMNLMQVDGYLQQVLLGLIILASLILGRDHKKR